MGRGVGMVRHRMEEEMAKQSAYPRIYAMLKMVGHEPLKAMQIIIDATRGDRFALQWIKSLHAGKWGEQR